MSKNGSYSYLAYMYSLTVSIPENPQGEGTWGGPYRGSGTRVKRTTPPLYEGLGRFGVKLFILFW